MLVTRSSPVFGAVCVMVPVAWPAAFTDSTWVPGVPRSCWSYCASRPGLADQVHPGEAGDWQVLAASSPAAVIGLQVAEHLRRVGPVRRRVAGHRLHLRGDPGELGRGPP